MSGPWDIVRRLKPSFRGPLLITLHASIFPDTSSVCVLIADTGYSPTELQPNHIESTLFTYL